MRNSPKQRSWLLLIVSFFFSGCVALPFLIPPLIEFGANLLTTAAQNYDKPYKEDLQNLLVAVQQPIAPYGGNPNQGYGYDPNAGGYAQGQGRPYPSNQGPPGYDPNLGYPEQPGQAPYAGNPNQGYGYDPNAGGYAQGQGRPYPSNQGPPGYDPNRGYPEQPGQAPYEGNPNQGYGYDPNAGGYAQRQGSPYSDNHPQPNPEPISLDVLLTKKHVVNGVPSYLPIRDGDILRDGRGDPQAGDKFRIMFRAKTQCYVYVIAIDGSAWAQGVFPPPGNPFANPVKPGQQVVIPEGSNWFSLDQYKGIETIFFVASQERRPDLEQILTKITGRERHPGEKPASVTEPAIIPRGYSGAKASRSPFALHTSQGQQHELIPTTFFVQTAGEALRVTRWFRHQ